MSFGRGGQEAIMAVFLNAKGQIDSQSKFDTLNNPQDLTDFERLIEERKPDVIAIGGFNAETHRLRTDTDAILKNLAAKRLGSDGMPQGMSDLAAQEYLDAISQRQTRLIYVQDEVARLYMNSARALQENPAWPPNARYALALARYVQDPLNEYCALGADITAVSYNDKNQALVS
jgi:transcription elongation factor SPT6